MSVLQAPPAGADPRVLGWLPEASPEVRDAWHAVHAAVTARPPEVGLTAGDRPAADVEVLAGAFGSCEYLLAARMHAASLAGCLPLGDRGGLLAARGWSLPLARRLARCAALADQHPAAAAAWSAGAITSEHLDPIARAVDRFTPAELSAVLAQLEPQWGHLSPRAIAGFVAAADRLLHPPADPTGEEADAYQSRDLSFAILADSVVLSGQLPRLEGELVIGAIDALAERLRSTADHVPAGARRADALVQLVNDAHATDTLPTRGGLPVALTVTLDQTATGDAVWRTGRGYLLTEAEARWASCDATVTPVLVTASRCSPRDEGLRATIEGGVTHGDAPLDNRTSTPTPAERVAALARALFDTRIPLDVGRTQRTATAAQRRALAIRDGGCIIPGCAVPAEACQTHHLQEWTAGGATSIENLALLCWAHHRQVDLGQWAISRRDRTGWSPDPEPGAAPGRAWPANNHAPFTITRTPRTRWRT